MHFRASSRLGVLLGFFPLSLSDLLHGSDEGFRTSAWFLYLGGCFYLPLAFGCCCLAFGRLVLSLSSLSLLNLCFFILVMIDFSIFRVVSKPIHLSVYLEGKKKHLFPRKFLF